MTSASSAPVLFVSHGSPMVALYHDEYDTALTDFARSVPKPKAIVTVSAHFEARTPLRVTASPAPPTIHDFGGFPDALRQLRYPAPGDPDLARTVLRHLETAGFEAELDPERGLDHGVWVPLRFLYPEADVPVVLVSLGVPRTADELHRLGEALAPLRDSGVMIFGSGGVVHNLRRVHYADKHAEVDDWARAFDTWVEERLEARDASGLQSYRDRGPGAELAVPTSEHYDPLLVALGASREGERARHVYRGFQHGNISMRCVAFGV